MRCSPTPAPGAVQLAHRTPTKRSVTVELSPWGALRDIPREEGPLAPSRRVCRKRIRLWDATTVPGQGPHLGTPDRSRSGFVTWDGRGWRGRSAWQRAHPADVGIAGGGRPDDVAQVLCQATCGTGRVLGQVQEMIQVGDHHSAGLYRPQYHGQAWHPTLVTAQPTPNVAPETNVCGKVFGTLIGALMVSRSMMIVGRTRIGDDGGGS